MHVLSLIYVSQINPTHQYRNLLTNEQASNYLLSSQFIHKFNLEAITNPYIQKLIAFEMCCRDNNRHMEVIELTTVFRTLGRWDFIRNMNLLGLSKIGQKCCQLLTWIFFVSLWVLAFASPCLPLP